MVILVIFLLVLVSIIYWIHYQDFNKSSYKDVSDHDFFNTTFNAGLRGEYKVFQELESLELEKQIYTNLYVSANHRINEIDVVLLTRKGVFVFEMKNYGGTIYGDENEKFWTQVLTKNAQHQFYNPIWQNRGHVNALKTYLMRTNSKSFYSYVVFGDRCHLNDLSKNFSSTTVINQCELMEVLVQHLNKLSNVMSNNEYQRTHTMLQSCTHASEATKRKHRNQFDK